MSSFLTRYTRGEHEQVWADLLALGAAVREEPLLTDALAVARERMRRVRHNIELLLPRLHTLGVIFGDDWVFECPPERVLRRPDRAESWRAWVIEAQQVYCTYAPPQPDVLEHITELEQKAGILPLSLRAWYEVVGTVDLVGKPPPGWSRDALGYPRPDEHAQHLLRDRFAAAAGQSGGLTEVEYHHFMRENDTLWHAVNDWEVYLDPLCVLPIEVALDESFVYASGAHIPVAPDYAHKWFQGDDDPYVIIVPSPAADAELINEWHGTTFVDYLRTAFHWGGFPGLSRAAHPPQADLTYLREGLFAM